jgi:tetratricopeptide (TPR) repeat protein
MTARGTCGGRWNAEIERLSNIEEFFAKTLLGGKVFNEASWDEAIRCLRKAVEIRPDYIFHRLDLAEVLIERKRSSEARPELEKILTLPDQDAMDPAYKARAQALLKNPANRAAPRVYDAPDATARPPDPTHPP